MPSPVVVAVIVFIGIEGFEFDALVLDDGDIFAAGLTFGFFFGTRDVDDDVDFDFRVQRNVDFVKAEFLDRLAEGDLTAINAEAALGDGLCDVAGRNRAIKLTGVASLPNDDESLDR